MIGLKKKFLFSLLFLQIDLYPVNVLAGVPPLDGFSPKHVFKEGEISWSIGHQYSNCYGVGPPFPSLDLLDYGLGKNRACI